MLDEAESDGSAVSNAPCRHALPSLDINGGEEPTKRYVI